MTTPFKSSAMPKNGMAAPPQARRPKTGTSGVSNRARYVEIRFNELFPIFMCTARTNARQDQEI